MTALLIESHECYLRSGLESISDFRSGWHQREQDWKFARGSLILDVTLTVLEITSHCPCLSQIPPYLMASSPDCCKHKVDAQRVVTRRPEDFLPVVAADPDLVLYRFRSDAPEL